MGSLFIHSSSAALYYRGVLEPIQLRPKYGELGTQTQNQKHNTAKSTRAQYHNTINYTRKLNLWQLFDLIVMR